MKLKPFTALEPRTVDEARSFLRKHKDNAVIKAGGTALVPEMKMGLVAPEYVVLLNCLEGMDGIIEKKDGLHIGAMASLHDIRTSPLVKKEWAPLAEAVEQVSAPGLHYQSTLGGNICQNTRCKYYNQSEFWRKVKGMCYKRGGDRCHVGPGIKRCQSIYQGDLAPLLICLDAKAVVASPRKEEKLPLSGLFTGRGEKPLRLASNQMITEFVVPPIKRRKAGYEKLRERGSLDYPELGIAAMLDMKGKTVSESRFVLTAMGSGPVVVSDPFLRARKLDQAFIDDAAGKVISSLKPVSNLRSSPTYRKKMAGVLVKRLLGRWVV
jgi:4-hydroxybenzoyl-CoA reductase subunit beta